MIETFSEMTEIPNTLFSETQRKELSTNEPIVKKQRDAIQKWKDDLDAGILDIESHNKDRLRDLMIDALGYPRDKIKAETGEKNTRLDYSYTPNSGTGGILFELKSRNKKLFEHQGYDKKEQDTPVDQAITYMELNSNINYAVITNFEQFVLITRQDLRAQCYSFTFPPKGMKLLSSEIKEFVHFFSKDGIKSGFIEKAKTATIREEEEITKDFYKLYHQTRLMLIHAFNEKKRIEHDDAIKITQTYLNRLIFLFFAEDNYLIKKRVFTDGVLAILNAGNIKEKTRDISGFIQTLFSWMDEGSDEIDNKSGFNGEFFKEPIDGNAYFYDFQTEEFFKDITKKVQAPSRIKLNKENQIAIDRYDGKINAIIVNFLKMAQYNFKHQDPNDEKDADDSNEQISVNILGHIFEQSIGDLEELQSQEISQKKKEGVFYTPDYITTYICKNTIIPYLSKNGATEPYQLVMEYKENIQELEDKIDQIKILDPACGSGAFLVKAVDILILIIDEIQNFKYTQGVYTISKKGKKESGTAKQMTFDKEHEIDKAKRKLIQNNIYGVDLNSESVEITKLSLFLKIATKNKRLIGLSQRIKVGNSIINDSTLDKKAFDWKTEFAEILGDNIPESGFDIVVGNPPYVRQEMLSEIKPYLKEYYSVYHGVADLYVYFIERGILLLKENGFFSIIVSNKFTKSNYGKKLREYLLNFKFNTFLDFGDLDVFKDASTYPCIINLQRTDPTKYVNACKIDSLNFTSISDYIQDKLEKIEINSLKKSSWSFSNAQTHKIFEKMSKNSISFGKLVNNKFYRGVTTGLNTAFVINEEKKKEIIAEDPKSEEIIFPYLSGKEIKRYGIEWKRNFLIFTKRDIDISQYPAILKHLKTFHEQLQPKKNLKDKVGRKPGKYKWYEIQDSTNYWTTFLDIGIIYPHFNKQSNFTLSKGNFFPNAKGYQIVSDDCWLLAILNSKLINFYLKSICPFVKGEYYEYNSQYIKQIPISLNTKYRKRLDDLAQKILVDQEEIIKIRNKMEDRIFFTFKINTISETLEDFHLLKFNEFLKTIYQKSKIKLSLNEQDAWQEYFDKNKDMIIKLENKIKILEKEIDVIVYEVYGITDKEQFIVETK